MKLIELKNVSFGYSSQVDTLKNINMGVEQGEFLCIVGENGSGKSTLMKCILGLNKVKKGKIDLKCRIGYLPQLNEIQNHFPATIEEIVLSGTITDNIMHIFYNKNDKEKVNRIMKKLGIYDIRKKCFYELSGGQKQRVLIARALCSTEKIIILDEPVNGLDPKISIEIYELLYKLNKENNLTIIMVSHDVDRIMNYCSRVIKIENGEIAENYVPQKIGRGGTDKC